MTIAVQYDRVLRSHFVKKERGTNGADLYVAWFPGLEGCRAESSKDDGGAEAVGMLYELLPRYLEALRAVGVSEESLRTALDQAPGISSQIIMTTTGTSVSSAEEPRAAV